jgi:hypothetical protein
MNYKSENNPFWVRRAFWIAVFVCLWVGSLILGITGAIPYGGGGAAIRLWAALTWLFVLWLAFRVVRALLSPFFRSSIGKTTESDADVVPESGSPKSSEEMAMCKHCHTETPLTDPNCAWCGEILKN